MSIDMGGIDSYSTMLTEIVNQSISGLIIGIKARIDTEWSPNMNHGRL